MGTVTDYPSHWAPLSPQAVHSPPSVKDRSKAKSASPVDGDTSGTVKSQIVLTKEQAVEIYGLRRVTADHSPKLAEIAGKSALVAEVYNVSPKTIRDIWNRKTWTQATRQFWTEEETSVHAFEHVKMMLPAYMPGYAPTTELMAIKQKPRGRPPGSKDSRPRKRRNLKDGEEDSGDGEANTTSLRELRDEIAEWSSARVENTTSVLNEPCEPSARPHEWAAAPYGAHNAKLNPLSFGPLCGDKRKPSEEPKGADAEWHPAACEATGASASHLLPPSQPPSFSSSYALSSSFPHSAALPQHLPSSAPMPPPYGSTLHSGSSAHHSPLLTAQPPASGPFDAFVQQEAFPPGDACNGFNGAGSCGVAPSVLGPPPRLDLGLDECLRAMSTEGESLLKARISLEQALQPSPEARVITEAQRPFRIVHVNESWGMLCGFRRKEVVGNTLNMIQGPATDPNALSDLVHRIQAREEARTMLVNYKKGGFPFLNMLQVQPLVDAEGVVTHYLGVLEDVTLKDYLHPLAHYVRDLRSSLGYAQ